MDKTPKSKLKEMEDKYRGGGAKLEFLDTTNSNPSAVANKEFEFTCKFQKQTNSTILKGVATAPSKKAAEHAACQKVLDLLNTEGNPGPAGPAAVANIQQRMIQQNISTPRAETKVTSKIVYYSDNLLGQGGYAKVYEGYFETPTRKAAVKICSKEINHYEKTKELEIMRKLAHPNVVTYFITEDIGPNIYIVMELASSTLEDKIKRNPSIDLKLCHKWAVESTKGLIALHESKVVHRDLKPSNVLIFPTNVAKLSDFGISKELDSFTQGVVTEAGRGTPIWMPVEGLEAIGNLSFNLLPSFDIFSLGLTIAYTMTRGDHLFAYAKNESPFKIQSNIVQYSPNWSWLAGIEWIPLRHLLEALIHKDPNLRPNANVALEHPFFWDSKKGLDFVLAVVNDIKNKETGCTARLAEMYTKFCVQAKTSPNWKSRLCVEVQSFLSYKDTMREQKIGNFGQLKKYSESSLLKLIEFIRDYNQHYKDWDQFNGGILKKDNIFGTVGSNYAQYFAKKYPELTTILYAFFQDQKYHGIQVTEFYNLNKNNCFSKWQ